MNRCAPIRRERNTAAFSDSRTETAAKVSVLGSIDEGELKRSAAYDFTRLRRGIRVDATSAVLEIGCGVGRLGMVFAPACRMWTGCYGWNMFESLRSYPRGAPACAHRLGIDAGGIRGVPVARRFRFLRRSRSLTAHGSSAWPSSSVARDALTAPVQILGSFDDRSRLAAASGRFEEG